MPQRVHLIISGRVQGVGFRFFCVDLARQHGIRGWVRNTEDGAVEVMAEGEEADLKLFVQGCRRGPRGALVRDCQETNEPPAEMFDSFEVTF
ncbi:MAG: acylphosphatase [Lentisphaerae bacterium]|nr:acylphosphatase [Lentisphaerota bacterium]